MATERRYSKEEFVQRGKVIYEKEIRPHLKPSDKGKLVAIDIETGAYEMGKSEIAVIARLRRQIPDAQIWMVRVGYSTVHGLGGQPRQETP
jgi:hypothetical protein